MREGHGIGAFTAAKGGANAVRTLHHGSHQIGGSHVHFVAAIGDQAHVRRQQRLHVGNKFRRFVGQEGARRILIGGYRSTLDEQGRQEEFWLGQAVSGLDTTAEELAEQLETVTLEQVVEMANKLELDTIYFLKGKEA